MVETTHVSCTMKERWNSCSLTSLQHSVTVGLLLRLQRSSNAHGQLLIDTAVMLAMANTCPLSLPLRSMPEWVLWSLCSTCRAGRGGVDVPHNPHHACIIAMVWVLGTVHCPFSNAASMISARNYGAVR